MSTLYTLDKLREDVDREFAPLKIAVGDATYVLRNLLRIDETDRDAVMEAMKDVEAAAADEDTETEADLDDVKKFTAAINFVLATVTADGKGAKLIEAFNGDMMVAMKVLELWSEATQPGEARNSPA
ncbi:phage tail assembly protein [Amycolatopsis minnesotensis]|uniref:Tail assembly chaperone n=1 Tax=Amycolatopsis minnesotensis TaxID=337894 RepID=A0ABN2Q106_9PSEU